MALRSKDRSLRQLLQVGIFRQGNREFISYRQRPLANKPGAFPLDLRPSRKTSGHGMPVPANTRRKALVAWLYAMALVHLSVSIVLTWAGHSGMLDGYLHTLDHAFWAADTLPVAAREQQLWWLAVFGATLQSYSLYMLALVHLGNRFKTPIAWGGLIDGIVLWAPQDLWFSLDAKLWLNLWIDGVALLTLLPPLFWLYRHDRRANASKNDAVHR